MILCICYGERRNEFNKMNRRKKDIKIERNAERKETSYVRSPMI